MHLILQEEFWFVHIPFGSMNKCKLLAQFLVDHIFHLVMSHLVLFLHKFAAFTYDVIIGFELITT